MDWVKLQSHWFSLFTFTWDHSWPTTEINEHVLKMLLFPIQYLLTRDCPISIINIVHATCVLYSKSSEVISLRCTWNFSCYLRKMFCLWAYKNLNLKTCCISYDVSITADSHMSHNQSQHTNFEYAMTLESWGEDYQ